MQYEGVLPVGWPHSLRSSEQSTAGPATKYKMTGTGILRMYIPMVTTVVSYQTILMYVVLCEREYLLFIPILALTIVSVLGVAYSQLHSAHRPHSAHRRTKHF